MIDRREQLMIRLMAILNTVDGIRTVVRNRGLMRDEQRPAIVLLDGDESVRLQGSARSDSLLHPTTNTSSPEIYVLMNEMRVNNKDADDVGVGTFLNQYRVAILGAINASAELRSLLGPNGRIQYRGAVTDLKSGGALSGEMRMDFSFDYPFNPN